MKRPTTMLWFTVGVITAMLLVGGLLLRDLDLNRIEAKRVQENARAVRVLCDRGFILIDLMDAVLVFVSMRLEADIRRGDTFAVLGGQEFLKRLIINQEKLIAELTGDSPCAVP